MTKELKVVKESSKSAGSTEIDLLVESLSAEEVGPWSKDRVAESLMLEAGLEKEKADDIATVVEDRISQLKISRISTSLVRELVNNELLERGENKRLKRYQCLEIPISDIESFTFAKSNANSNINNNNPESVAFFMSENITKKYALRRVFSQDVTQAHLDGRIYIHDLGMVERLYCFGGNIPEYLKKYGLQDLDSLSTKSFPASTANTLVGHINTFLSIIQAYFAGALGLGFLNIFFAPYLMNMSREQVYNLAQHFVFSLSQNCFSRGAQVLFIDLNLHFGIPKVLKDVPAIGPKGKYMIKMHIKDTCNNSWIFYNDKPEIDLEKIDIEIKRLNEEAESTVMGDVCYGFPESVKDDNIEFRVMTYGDFEQEAQMFLDVILQLYKEGDKQGNFFYFPKIDLHITKECFEDETQKALLMKACETASVNGTPYFIYDRDSTVLSQCCLEAKEPLLLRKEGKVFLGKAEDMSTQSEIIAVDPVSHKSEWVFPKHVITREESAIVEITARDGKQMRVTKDHPILILEDGEVKERKAEALKEGDFVLRKVKWEDSLFSINYKEHKGVLIDEEYAFMLGLFQAEGCKSKAGELCFALHKDELDLVNRVCDFFGLSFIRKQYVDKYHIWDIRVRSICSRIQFKEICEKYEKIPQVIWNSPLSVMKAYIEGFYAGDGWKYSNYTLKKGKGIGINDANLSVELSILHDMIGIPTTYREHSYTSKKGKHVGREFFHQVILYQTSVSKHSILYDRIPHQLIKFKRGASHLLRIDKKEKLIGIDKLNSLCDQGYVERAQVDRCMNDPIRYIPIEKVEVLSGEFKVYDIELPKFNWFVHSQSFISHNCRLKVEINDEELIKHPESIRFCALQNVTINLPQAAYRAGKGNFTDFIDEVYKSMDFAMKAHEQKARLMKKCMKPGAPLYTVGKAWSDKLPWVDLDKSTRIIGILGLNEAMQFLFDKGLDDEKSYKKGLETIVRMYHKCEKYEKEFECPVRLEETPAESLAYRAAKVDLQRFPEQAKSVVRGSVEGGGVYYSNSVHLPVDSPVGIVERVKKQSAFHPLVRSGSMVHAWVNDSLPEPGSLFSFLQKVYNNTACDQICVSPNFTFCKDCDQRSVGLLDECPYCKSKNLEHVSRVTGYFSKVENYNAGKKQEVKDRLKGDCKVEEKQFYEVIREIDEVLKSDTVCKLKVEEK
jgi:anaerobic ribonucleoside-triphosphate reductase/intein/homing endonuclease